MAQEGGSWVETNPHAIAQGKRLTVLEKPTLEPAWATSNNDTLIVVQGDGPNLLRRNWMQKFKFILGECQINSIERINSLSRREAAGQVQRGI